MSGKLSIVIEKDDFGYYAYCPELKGCHSQGETFQEAEDNIREAIELYWETLDSDEKSIIVSKGIYTTSHEVSLV